MTIPRAFPSVITARYERSALGQNRTFSRPALVIRSSPIVDIEWSLSTLREKLVKVGAKVVRHERYVTFQLAEVAIPLPLFAEILQLIAGLRPRPAPT